MKKIGLLIIILLSVCLCSCKDDKPIEEVDIYLPDGTPALAMANLLDEGFTYENTKTNFHIVPAGNIVAEISAATCDLGIMPITAAATIYNKGVAIQLASVNIFGNLHIVGTNELASLDELKGELVYTTVGTTIAMTQYILKQSGIEVVQGEEAVADKVTLCSKNEASEIIPLLSKAVKDGKEAYGVLGEPVVTKALSLPAKLKLTFDLQKCYKDIKGTEGYPQAGLVVKKEFLSQHEGYVDALIAKLEENSSYLLEHTADLPNVFKKYDSSLQQMTFTADTINRCNVRVAKANTIKNDVISYVKDLAKIELTDQFFC